LISTWVWKDGSMVKLQHIYSCRGSLWVKNLQFKLQNYFDWLVQLFSKAYADCLKKCNDLPDTDCTHFTFSTSAKKDSCLLHTGCKEINPNLCKACISGERLCRTPGLVCKEVIVSLSSLFSVMDFYFEFRNYGVRRNPLNTCKISNLLMTVSTNAATQPMQAANFTLIFQVQKLACISKTIATI